MTRSVITRIILPGCLPALCLALSCAGQHRPVGAHETTPPGGQMQNPVHPPSFQIEAARHGDHPEADDALKTLAGFMSGRFSSEEQARTDSSYFDIRLVMEPIWTGRTDGVWLYVEQAVAGHEDRPYRQRVYRLTQHRSDEFESAVFLLPDPEQFIGAWGDPRPFADLRPDDLEPRSGCSMHLTRGPGGSFQGGTRDRDCPSDLRGASYATSSVRIEDGVMYTWDQGFDDAGSQVWGPTEGGYIFRRQPEH